MIETTSDLWKRGADNIYLIKYPKNISIDYAIKLTTEIVHDYTEHRDSVPNFLVLVDGSEVEEYNQLAMNVIMGKAQNYMHGRVAVYNLSEYYKNIVKSITMSKELSDHIKYFDNEKEARTWIEKYKDGGNGDLSLMPNETIKEL